MNQVSKRLILMVRWVGVLFALAIFASSLFAQDPAMEKVLSTRERLEPFHVTDPANGAGVFVAGDLWESFLPSGVGHYYSEIPTDPTKLWDLVRIGNFDRGWRHPTAMYPGEHPESINWSGDIRMLEYNADPNFNPFAPAGEKNYAFTFFRNPVAGAISRTSKEVYFEDATKRHVALYEAEFPTNLGINVKLTGRQYTLNWNNFNDFIVLEIQLTNTGVLDVDGDGTPEKTGNKINALVLGMQTEVMFSSFIGATGGRLANHFGSGRNGGYDGTPDATGSPWATTVEFAGANPANVVGGTIPKGKNDLGLNAWPLRNYTDLWLGYTWMAAKQGDGNFGNSDKKTIFDSHPIGEGPERGRYLSVGNGQGGVLNIGSPRAMHTAYMGTWYKNGGKTFKNSDFDLNPNSNYFQSGTLGNPTTFVPKPAGQRGFPDGDAKLNGTFAQKWEDDWTAGYNAYHNFDGDLFCGIGPFSLEVGETMTLVFVEYGGYRLEGIRGALNAARWAYQNGWKIPEPPPTPDLKMEPAQPTPGNYKLAVKWDNRAESASDFAGYKIYRASTAPKFNSVEGGMRLLDRYQEQTTAGQDLTALLDPVNPYFDPPANFLQPQTAGGWGPYTLVKNIPKSDLAQNLNNDSDAGQYKYKFVDDSRSVSLGVTYWYFVSAYDNESGSAAGASYTSLETSNLNRNGRSGLWEKTYPFATSNSFYPAASDAATRKNMGIPFVVVGPVVNVSDLQSGAQSVRVSPNPYKRQAIHDVGQEHKILFRNLPSKAKINIFDVSGQLIDMIDFAATSPDNGTVFWDMFSKDGQEVADGLYVYIVEYDGGQQTGYFSIMR